MPELPDVEATCLYLARSGLLGKQIIDLDLQWPKAVRTPSLEQFVLELRYQRFTGVKRRAKFILLSLDSGQSLVAHLRMTGSLLVEPASTPRPTMTRNVFVLDDGQELRFVDPRKLGQLWLLENISSLLGKLGPEPLDPGFTPGVLAERLSGHGAPVKALLCDQEVVAGIGNIYADEVLFACGVHPLRPGSSITIVEANKMHQAIVTVLEVAIKRLAPMMPLGGPPTETKEGSQGLLVPRKNGATCSRCGGPISRVPVRGRSTYFCPSCQR